MIHLWQTGIILGREWLQAHKVKYHKRSKLWLLPWIDWSIIDPPPAPVLEVMPNPKPPKDIALAPYAEIEPQPELELKPLLEPEPEPPLELEPELESQIQPELDL